ncbi:MAG: hypothetical protein Q7R62_01770 [bacterium]|nr:hypothetical protein [bacterium]
MTEVIHDVDSSNGGIMAVILIIVIAIGGFLVWRFTTNAPDKEPGTVNVQILPTPTSNSN